MFLAIKAIEPFPLTYALFYKFNNSFIRWPPRTVYIIMLSLFMYYSILVKYHMMCTMNGGTLRPEPEPIATTKPFHTSHWPYLLHIVWL